MLHSDVTGKILRAYYNVYNELGFGFLEKNYERAMKIELLKMNVKCSA
jgi:GxxExxY protein